MYVWIAYVVMPENVSFLSFFLFYVLKFPSQQLQ